MQTIASLQLASNTRRFSRVAVADYRLMQMWVEGLSDRFDRREAVSVEDASQFALDQQDTVGPGDPAQFGWQPCDRSLEIIEHREQVKNEDGLPAFDQVFALLLDPAAKVRIVGLGALPASQVVFFLRESGIETLAQGFDRVDNLV